MPPLAAVPDEPVIVNLTLAPCTKCGGPLRCIGVWPDRTERCCAWYQCDACKTRRGVRL